jgi:hypothetical protein
MASDSREGASTGQDKTSSRPSRTGPAKLDPAAIYSTESLTAELNISDETLTKWVANGLKRPDKKKLNMNYQAYFGDLVIQHMRNNLES